jgi:hypothetical protein
VYYDATVKGTFVLSPTPISQRIRTMKTAIRIFALTAVVAGAAAAAITPSAAKPVVSHQSATAKMPIPLCAPGLPGCPGVADAR